MPRLLIIADDLSGAADAAGASHSDSLVMLNGMLVDAHADAVVVAVDIDSRQVDAETARHRAATATSGAPEIVFHKIDSLLRGNWPFELRGILQALGKRGRMPLALVAPAWPERNRTTVEGRVWVDGAPLSASGMRDDGGHVLHGNIAARLAEAGLSSLPMPGVGVEGVIDSDALVCDATSRETLDRIAAMAVVANRPVLCVGSGGLAQSLARALLLPHHHIAAIKALGPVLVVVGSASEVSHRQVGRLRDSGTAVLLLTPGATSSLDGMDELLRAGRDVVVALQGPGHGSLEPDVVADLAAHLVPLLPRSGGLILTGGETARAILTAAGVNAIRTRGEVEPGVPIGVTQGAVALPVVTKAGAFGDDDTLMRALAALRPSARPT